MRQKLVNIFTRLYTRASCASISGSKMTVKSFLETLFHGNEKITFIESVKREVERYKLEYAIDRPGHLPKACDTSIIPPKKCVKSVKKSKIEAPKKLQFVFISIDPENLQGTITAIDHYMDFVDHYLVITNRSKINEMEKIKSVHSVKVVDEATILPEDSSIFSKRDHQSKNWILRASLLELETLQEQFIMLDDDNRPLRKIPIEHFIERGKYNAYYFYDLDQWHYYDTEYDSGQHYTKEILHADGLELYSYSSHKPQIIDRSIFREVVQRYGEIGAVYPIDEWSIYFNYAVTRYPHLFTKKIFDVLNWPDHPLRWEWIYIPKEFNFENYYKEIYENGLFSAKHTLSFGEKISLKEKEIAPVRDEIERFGETVRLNKRLRQCLEKNEMIHNNMLFMKDDFSMSLCGLPYYGEAISGAWFKIPLRYSMKISGEHTLQLTYRLHGDLWFSSRRKISASDPQDGFISLDINVREVPPGLYQFLLDIELDQEPTFGGNSPYMMELKIIQGQ